jgi:hypothetical protein
MTVQKYGPNAVGQMFIRLLKTYDEKKSMENVTRRIFDHTDIDTRRRLGIYRRRRRVPSLDLTFPKQFKDTGYYHTQSFLWDTENLILVFNRHKDGRRYMEYFFQTNEVVEFEMNVSFKMYKHPDFISL